MHLMCLIVYTTKGGLIRIYHSYKEQSAVLRKITILLFCDSRFSGGVFMRSVRKIVQ